MDWAVSSQSEMNSGERTTFYKLDLRWVESPDFNEKEGQREVSANPAPL